MSDGPRSARARIIMTFRLFSGCSGYVDRHVTMAFPHAERHIAAGGNLRRSHAEGLPSGPELVKADVGEAAAMDAISGQQNRSMPSFTSGACQSLATVCLRRSGTSRGASAS
jgi:hypothetical protein